MEVSALIKRWRFTRPNLVLSLAVALAVLLGVVGVMKIQGWGIFHRTLVRVGFNQFPPYVDKGSNGVPVGFAVEILTQAAQKAKIDLRWVEIHGSANKAFAEGKADMYPLMTITPERQSEFHMSPPWWENQFALISTEGQQIPNVAASRGKLIASRIGLIQTLSRRVFPEARFVDMLTVPEMETALCEKQIDGFFSDVRLLEAQLLQRTTVCAGQALHAISVPDSKLYLGTASTKAAASANDRIFREIAKLALDGTLAHAAANWGVVTPYDTARMKEVVDAETREKLMAYVLVAVLVILTISVIQTRIMRRAMRQAVAAQAEAREMSDRFDEFMKHTPTITFIKDERRQVVYSNEDFSQGSLFTGSREPPALTGLTGRRAVSGQLCLKDDEVLKSGRGVEVMETLRGSDGKSRHFLVLKFPFRGAKGARLLGGVALDVTARINAEKELEHHAKSDLLTGLPNRRNFMAELELALERSRLAGERLAIGFIDLDGFKRVNDQLGHEAGDELLKQVAERLTQVCHAPDIVARLGGDEFTFCLPAISPVDARRAMAAVLGKLEESFSIDGRKVLISASIGLSMYPENGSSSRQLLRNADSAMYCAKRNGKGRIEFWSQNQNFTVPLERVAP
jgi:diguanylate cyclase (GGDEF)-like protein